MLTNHFVKCCNNFFYSSQQLLGRYLHYSLCIDEETGFIVK